jgi:subtilisin family serine protease
VTVGVLDTRIASHDWLEGGWTAPSSAILSPPPGRPYRPEEGHATFIAGLILSQAPGATVRVRQVLNEQAQADCWTVAKEIVEFGQTGGLDILNLSFACYTEDGQPPLALSTAIDRLDPNIVVVAAAGNHGNLIEPESAESFGNQDLIEREHNMRKPAWPAALDRVIAVGATQDGGNSLAAFTPRDAEWIDLVVDGVDLLSTYLTGDVEVDPATKRSIKFSGWARWSGTSFAAALASGKIAANVRPGQHTARDATRLIQKHADTLRDVSSESTWTPRLVRVDPLRPIRATRRSGIRAIFDRC